VKKTILLLVLCLLVQLTPLIYRAIFGYGEYYIYPSLLSHTLLILPILIAFQLKNRYTKAFLAIWIIWLFVGELKILTYFAINPYYIAMDEAIIIYGIFVICLSLGMLVHDSRVRLPVLPVEVLMRGRPIYNDLGWLGPVLLVFPLIWLGDLVRNVGFIPIFSGTDVTDKMYELSYGYIYGYGFFNCLSAVLLYDRFLSSRSTGQRVFWIVMVLLALLIMSADSKRLYLLVSLLGIFVYDRIMAGSLTVNGRVVTAFVVAVVLYTLLQNVRLGNVGESPFARDGLPLGAEFREYVRAVNEYEPGQIPNYDLAASTVGAFLNSFLLKLAGFNKADLVAKDSAYSFMQLFDETNTLGIRTGLISELYFAYGFYGLIVMTIFGYITSQLSYRLIQVRFKSSLVFLSAIWALLVLTVFGQSSVTVGCLCVLLYLYIVLQLSRLARRRSPTTAPGADPYDLRDYPGVQPESLHAGLSGLPDPTNPNRLPPDRR
jgi:hypothetical protein